MGGQCRGRSGHRGAAEALLYEWLCKRPVFHDDYLPTFNQPRVHLVDTDGKGVQQIGAGGPIIDGKEYELDVLVCATGFQFTCMTTGTFNTITGRKGLTMTEKWADGTKTFLGMHVSDFPNLLIMAGPQAAGAAFNNVSLIENQVAYIAKLLTQMKSAGSDLVDVNPEAEKNWGEHCTNAESSARLIRDCVSYYNM